MRRGEAMRILILGGDGMLGHQLFKYLKDQHEVKVTLSQNITSYREYGMFHGDNSYARIDVRYIESLIEVLADFHPHAVINCIGIIKQRPEAKENELSLAVNSLLPHRLAVLCKAAGARLVHMSTDCIYSGKKGNYAEADLSDAEDLYGKSKFLGEVSSTNCITLRTSIIGRELSRKKSLLEWLFAQKGTIKGYRKAIFSGFTTIEMSRIIEKMLLEYPNASGLYHVSSKPISKYDLLCLIKDTLCLDVNIVPDDSVRIDRSLDSSLFRREFNYNPPTWDEMIEELRESKEIA